jgi:small basic protein
VKSKTTTTLVYTGVSGAVVGIILWLLNEFGHVTVPDEVAAWLAIIVGVAVGAVTGGKANGGVTPAKK